jgi:hypothetical protein
MGAKYVRTVRPKSMSTLMWSVRSSKWNQNSHDTNTEVQQHWLPAHKQKTWKYDPDLGPFAQDSAVVHLNLREQANLYLMEFAYTSVDFHSSVRPYAETCTWYREWKDVFFKFLLGLFHVNSWWELLRYDTSDGNTLCMIGVGLWMN